MGFKLVRVDATEPCKIPLAVGTHLIGRGKFLDCHDYRVSRNHGQLEVTDDTVRIISLHQNPCFFRRKCSDNTNILPQNEYIELSNGDQFGLVPESYWYELIYCIESLVPPCGDYAPSPIKQSTGEEPSVSGSSGNVSQIDTENTERVKPSASQSTFMDSEVQTEMQTASAYKRSHSEDSNETLIKKVKTEPQSPCLSSENQGINSENQPINAESKAANSECQAIKIESQAVNSESQVVNSESQAVTNEIQMVKMESQAVNSESQGVSSETQTVKIESQAVNSESQGFNSETQAVNSESLAVSNETQGTSFEDSIPDEGIPDTDEVNSSESEKETGTLNTEPCSQNTVKTEPNVGTVKTEPSNNNVNTEPNSQENVKPGPSNNQPGDAPGAAGVPADKAAGGAAAPAAAPAPAAPGAAARPREKCMYGAQCYRVNPAHKAQFSHPGDADWALRVPCRWGAACRDIRPAHWRDHDHPPRRDHQERRRGGHGVRKKRDKIVHRRQSHSTDSDDSSEPIITRTRNAGVPNNRIINDDSDSEKDPFASDDTDDWVPSDD